MYKKLTNPTRDAPERKFGDLLSSLMVRRLHDITQSVSLLPQKVSHLLMTHCPISATRGAAIQVSYRRMNLALHTITSSYVQSHGEFPVFFCIN